MRKGVGKGIVCLALGAVLVEGYAVVEGDCELPDDLPLRLGEPQVSGYHVVAGQRCGRREARECVCVADAEPGPRGLGEGRDVAVEEDRVVSVSGRV